MQHLPALIIDLAIILSIAGVTTLLFKHLKQPVVLGYIVAGFLVGPHIPYFPFNIDMESIQTWAEIGVIFLLFALGLDFSFKKLMNVGGPATITASVILMCMSIAGYLTGTLMGWGHMNSLFLGGMISMSSTTIIIKTFDDFDLRNKQFARLVFGVLIVEDLFAILMMVLLSTLAVKNNFEGTELFLSIIRLGFFLLCWFLVGIYLIPSFFKRTKSLMNDETMVVIAIGLCLGMVLLATKAGFSAALGAFVMGSILAETIEAERIEHLTKPLKDFFGAIFFVSVGGLIQPDMLITYIVPILIISVVVIIGQVSSATFGVMMSGQPLKIAVQSGFCFSQVGEFAFIIASLGLALKVTGDFLYPIVVAVSVLTTFVTPYIMRLSTPAYQYLNTHIPQNWIHFLERYSFASRTVNQQGMWNSLLRQLLRIILVYSVICIAIIALSLTFLVPLMTSLIPGILGQTISALLICMMLAPFLRAIIMKKNHSKEFTYLWKHKRSNWGPLISIVAVRTILCIGFIAFVLHQIYNATLIIILTISAVIITIIILSRRLKKQSIEIERRFKINLNERQLHLEKQSPIKDRFVNNLLSQDLHLADFEVKPNSPSVGKTLRELDFRNKCGINIISIKRGNHHINIPGGEEHLYPYDKIVVLGTDDELTEFTRYVAERYRLQEEKERELSSDEVTLNQYQLESDSFLIGKTIRNSHLRDNAGCMVVGLEREERSMMNIPIDMVFEQGDVLWIVGEKNRLIRMIEEHRATIVKREDSKPAKPHQRAPVKHL